MAKISNSDTGKQVTSKISRPGIHAKSRSSKLKSSKNYKKAYAGQGR